MRGAPTPPSPRVETGGGALVVDVSRSSAAFPRAPTPAGRPRSPYNANRETSVPRSGVDGAERPVFRVAGGSPHPARVGGDRGRNVIGPRRGGPRGVGADKRHRRAGRHGRRRAKRTRRRRRLPRGGRTVGGAGESPHPARQRRRRQRKRHGDHTQARRGGRRRGAHRGWRRGGDHHRGRRDDLRDDGARATAPRQLRPGRTGAARAGGASRTSSPSSHRASLFSF